MSTTAAINEPIRSTFRPVSTDWGGRRPYRMVAGLGAAWILDGLQITIASSVRPGCWPAPTPST